MYKKNKFPDVRALFYETAQKLTSKKSEEIAKLAFSVLKKQEADYFKVVSLYMDASNKPSLEAFNNVVWTQLSPKTIRRKGGKRRYWYSDSKEYGHIALKNFLKQIRVSDYFGEGEYYIDKFKVSKPYKYQRSIILFPSLMNKRKSFDNFRDGKKTQEAKVSGKNPYTGLSNEEARPIFDPMREHFTKHRIPQSINRELRKKGYKARFNFGITNGDR